MLDNQYLDSLIKDCIRKANAGTAGTINGSVAYGPGNFPYGQIQTSGYIASIQSDSSLWREYAAYLETQLSKVGLGFQPIASNATRTYPPKRVERTVYE